MRNLLCPLVILASLLVLAVPGAGAMSQARQEYRSLVEPICEANTRANDKILRGTRKMIKRDRLRPAGRRFVRASKAFGHTVRRVAAVPRPEPEAKRLGQWVVKLRDVRKELRRIGKWLLRRNKFQASQHIIRLRRAGNHANNITFGFQFRYCRISGSRFS